MSIAISDQELVRGERVWHRLYGAGRIVGEWRNFRSCKLCFMEMPLGAQIVVSERNGKFVSEEKAIRCRRCAGPTQVVTGDGIYDVTFDDGKTRSIQSLWLLRAGNHQGTTDYTDAEKDGTPRQSEAATEAATGATTGMEAVAA